MLVTLSRGYEELSYMAQGKWVTLRWGEMHQIPDREIEAQLQNRILEPCTYPEVINPRSVDLVDAEKRDDVGWRPVIRSRKGVGA
jgi:hypothetical protein